MLILIPISFFGLRILFDLSNPLRQPVTQIREELLEFTPIGMSINEVGQIIRDNEAWGWNGHIAPNGFPADPTFRVLIGSQSIRASLGGFNNIFWTSVIARWGFDEDGKLIDIHVEKHIAGW